MHKFIIKFYLLVAILLCPTLLHAQNQAGHNNPEQDLTLKQKYHEELNSAILRAYEGDRDAQFRVGVLFTNDQFVEPDYEQAVYWYKQAARQDHVLAQYNLGHQYLNGVGVLQSTESALNWWLKAARLGHPLSQFNVGRAYYLGIGLPGDLKKSKYWFEQAAANQEPKSIEILAQTKWDSIAQEPNEPKSDDDLALLPTQSQAVSTRTPQQPQTSPNDVTQAALKPVTVSTPVATSQATATLTTKPASTAEEAAPTTTAETVTLYTAPSGRSILISMVYNPSDLEIVKHAGKWTSVRHKSGFPIWIHKDFISVNGAQATLTGDAVNARAVPLIIEGSIVGKLNKGDKVAVINKTEKWYRVTSPSNFTAWVKTDELAAHRRGSITGRTTTEKTLNTPLNPTPLVDSNSWLFQQNPNNFTLQLASFDSAEGAHNFSSLSEFASDANLHKFTSAAKNITWTYFLYGSYSSKAKAKQAQVTINKKDAWVRNIAQIQQNRCIAWKKQLPTPKELNMYCTPSSN